MVIGQVLVWSFLVIVLVYLHIELELDTVAGGEVGGIHRRNQPALDATKILCRVDC